MKYTVGAWRTEAEKRFGERARDWSFQCPSCKGNQTAKDFVDRGETPDEAARLVYQACIKRKEALNRGARALKPGECDWVSYGLFRGPVTVVADDGTEVPVFDFSPAEVIA